MQKVIVLSIWTAILCYGIFGCATTTTKPVDYGFYELAPSFPLMQDSKGNELTALRIELGRQLFYDPVMSRDSTISCASCHKQRFAFADSLPTSPGIENRAGTQNVPSLTNIGFATSFTRAGGVPTLEMQILVPIQEHNEFDFNMVLISRRLMQIPRYDSMSQLAYGRPPDPFVISRSLANFERSMTSSNSPFDQYTYYGKKMAMKKAAKRGMELFMSERTNCSNCHTPPHFSNFAFENNGLYEVYADSGRMRLTHLETDRAVFKVASLRNIALTAPYMHDGSLATLEAVVNHYNQGGLVHKNKNALIRPLNLTKEEKADLVAFLEALTDESFIQNPAFSSP